MELSIHDSKRIEISTTKTNDTQWVSIKAFDEQGKEIIELAVFGKQELVLGENE